MFFSKNMVARKLKFQDFLLFSCIFLATKQTKTPTKPWSNSAMLTQSINKTQTTVRSKTQNQKYQNPNHGQIKAQNQKYQNPNHGQIKTQNQKYQNTSQSSSISDLISSKRSLPKREMMRFWPWVFGPSTMGLWVLAMGLWVFNNGVQPWVFNHEMDRPWEKRESPGLRWEMRDERRERKRMRW